jgi:flavin reductase (DIM6/NTAB) family NADH-FMN oxidoreductase RutF
MTLDFSKLSSAQIYGAMIQTIVPRPIAWVLSDNGDNTLNLAPFSFFNGVSSKPPTLSISIGRKRDRSKKDTWRNIEERGRFVVHIAQVDQAQQMSATSQPLDFGDSEATKHGIELVHEPGFHLPRIKAAQIAFDCENYQIVEIGDAPQGLVIGKINQAYIADAIAKQTDEGLQVDAMALNPLARLGGDDYATLGGTLTIPRPF